MNMGDFEIENGVLKKYKGSGDAIVIPDGVTSIGRYAFDGCSSLTSVTISDSVVNIGYGAFDSCSNLAFLTYHRLKFPPMNDLNLDKILDIAEKHDFSVRINSNVKYAIIWSIFKNSPEDEEVNAYIEENFLKMFSFLIDKDDIETVTAVIKSKKFLTKQNIDKFIQYAIDT